MLYVVVSGARPRRAAGADSPHGRLGRVRDHDSDSARFFDLARSPSSPAIRSDEFEIRRAGRLPPPARSRPRHRLNTIAIERPGRRLAHSAAPRRPAGPPPVIACRGPTRPWPATRRSGVASRRCAAGITVIFDPAHPPDGEAPDQAQFPAICGPRSRACAPRRLALPRDGLAQPNGGP